MRTEEFKRKKIIFHHTTMFLATFGTSLRTENSMFGPRPQSQLIVYSLKINVYLHTQSAD
jgi:hypothetical protein